VKGTAALEGTVWRDCDARFGLALQLHDGDDQQRRYGGTTDRPVIGSVVVARNAVRGNAIYDVTPFLQRAFQFTERCRLNLRIEAFNVFNHPNFVGYSLRCL